MSLVQRSMQVMLVCTLATAEARAEIIPGSCLAGTVVLNDFTSLSQVFPFDFQGDRTAAIQLSVDLPSVQLSIWDTDNNQICNASDPKQLTKVCAWRPHGDTTYVVRVDNSNSLQDASFTMCRDDSYEAPEQD